MFSNQLIKKGSNEMKLGYSFGYVGLYHIQYTQFFFVCKSRNGHSSICLSLLI